MFFAAAVTDAASLYKQRRQARTRHRWAASISVEYQSPCRINVTWLTPLCRSLAERRLAAADSNIRACIYLVHRRCARDRRLLVDTDHWPARTCSSGGREYPEISPFAPRVWYALFAQITVAGQTTGRDLPLPTAL